MSGNIRYKDLNLRTRLVRILLCASAVMAIIVFGTSFLQLHLLGGSDFSEAEAQANDFRQMVVGILSFVLFLITAVAFCQWIYRAQQNIRAAGAYGLTVSAGWAVGYFFIPVLGWWKPYKAMTELWQASHNPPSWRREPISMIVPSWWLLWIASCILSNVSFRTALKSTDVTALRSSTILEMIAAGTDIVLCVVAFALVSEIAAAQKKIISEQAGA